MKQPPEERYVLGHRSEDGSSELWHLDGVPWYKAPVPRRLHRCRVQTYGYIHYFDLVQRCACGAIRMSRPGRGQGPWMDRNQTRRRGR